MVVMLLSSLASRIRKHRKQLGFTQADLAQRAGVSARFLSQLESGKGNISVQRLADISAALSLSLGELFRGLGPYGPLVLSFVGLRGAGKSTLGALVANNLGIPFVELDQEIVTRSAMSLSEIFSFGGADYYHELQDRILKELLEKPEPLVLAVGGSIVGSTVSWERLRNHTKTVWLHAAPKTYLARVRAQGDLRPMKGRDNALIELKQLLAVRSPLYAQADLHIDTDSKELTALILELTDFYRGNP
jgi:XRE family aerobic/anaerobic benzoate catabolism transcriptional regulator